MPWEQDEDTIRSGHRNPNEFQPDTFRTVELSPTEGIKAVLAKPKGKHAMEVQSYLFDKSKGWTIEKAKEWFNEHLQKEKESHRWFGEIRKPQTEANNLIHGQALHPIRTFHPEEWPEVRQYLEEELLKATPTLIGKPLVLDHNRPLQGEVVNAQYKDGAIEYLAKLEDKEILGKVAEGKIKHCSVEFEWGTLERVNGFSPRNITFTGCKWKQSRLPTKIEDTVAQSLDWEAKGLTIA